jgi:hypothetical protein
MCGPATLNYINSIFSQALFTATHAYIQCNYWKVLSLISTQWLKSWWGGAAAPPPPSGKLTNFRKFWSKRGLKTVFSSANGGGGGMSEIWKFCRKFRRFCPPTGHCSVHAREYIAVNKIFSTDFNLNRSLWTRIRLRAITVQVSRESVEFRVRGKIYLYYTIYSGEPSPR